ncbi:hypothetical protein HRO26_00865 [Treponema pectinovorum]|uniref:hypothetical protein n=1 Tax=Treponema pectinovorum TaxID=164 RepID=UPI003D94DC1D
MTKKNYIILIVLFLMSFFALNAEPLLPSWKILEQAQVQFDSGNYGEALKLSNSALNTRKSEIAEEYKTLDIALTPAQVRRVGVEFNKVLEVLKEREQKKAIFIITKYLNLYGETKFKDDVHVMLEWLKNKDSYPEANYLIGKIYNLEGEYDVALDFYKKSYLEKEYLDIPDVEYDILYSMAFLFKLKNDEESFEKTLLLILSGDKAFNDELLKSSILRTINSDKAENVDRLFFLYRATANNSFKALYELGNLYENRGDERQALFCSALGSLEAFTHILSIIQERDSHFNYTTYKAFLEECSKYEEIVNWGTKNNIWETFFIFTNRSAKQGNILFAKKMYSVLETSIPDDYYKKLAGKMLLSGE